jgi:5-oxopent-3-ene-1,2,5-tricarboxylate decarboxylase / 2-hydroxyhepta-2,4-diene-1,7-dioate isomerase
MDSSINPGPLTPAPPRPGKIIAVHLNYPSRAKQRGRVPAFPSYFLKPASSVSSSGAAIERPAGTELLAFEGEVALIIGRRTRRVSQSEAWAAVSGVTAANDFGIYDLRYADKGSNVRAKGGDGFTPLGPAILPANRVAPDQLRLRTWVNGKLAQEDTTATLLFPFPQLIADLSQLITLEPGDVILTGTPAGSSVVKPGDVVEVEVDVPSEKGTLTTGRLRTTVVEGSERFSDAGAQPMVDEVQRAEAWGLPDAGAKTGKKFVFTDELRSKLASVSTATLSSQLRKRGMNNVSIDGLSSTRPDRRLIGRARTLRYIAHREDLFESHGGGYNAQKRAFDTLEEGEILVMEARGEPFAGTVGDIMALRAQVRGATGIVTDGAARDIEALKALDIPVYCSGPHPAVLGRRHVPWEVDVTISCGGAAVQPGDVIVGDADGLVIIPPSLAEEIADGAVEQERQERFIAEQVAKGEAMDGLYPMNAAWLKKYKER